MLRDKQSMTNNFREKANFIWQVADDILRSAFKAGPSYGQIPVNNEKEGITYFVNP
jgi:hypothetical protein